MIIIIALIQIISRPQSPNYNKNGNRSRRQLSRMRLCNVRNYVNSLLHQEQTYDTVSSTENTETQDVSEEQLVEQQFNDLLFN